jgi:hypothetical protein
MRRRGDVPTRGEVTEKVDRSGADMDEKEEQLDTIAGDVETVRETLESLDLGGTADGSDEIEAAVEDADEVAVDAFDEQDGELEELQGENEEFEGELDDRSDVSESDLDKLTDASSRIETDGAATELAKAEEAARGEIEFLQEHIERERAAREESERAQQEYEARVRTRTGG